MPRFDATRAMRPSVAVRTVWRTEADAMADEASGVAADRGLRPGYVGGPGIWRAFEISMLKFA